MGIHGRSDGKLGKADENLQKSFQGVVDRFNKCNLSKLEERKISIRTADIGLLVTTDECGETTIDEKELMKIFEEHDPNTLILSFCYTDINELNDILRSQGLYADLIIRKDHSNVVGFDKGKLIQFDPEQWKI